MSRWKKQRAHPNPARLWAQEVASRFGIDNRETFEAFLRRNPAFPAGHRGASALPIHQTVNGERWWLLAEIEAFERGEGQSGPCPPIIAEQLKQIVAFSDNPPDLHRALFDQLKEHNS